MSTSPLDVLLLVPFEPPDAFVSEPEQRLDFGVPAATVVDALGELSSYVGIDLANAPRPARSSQALGFRSLTSITLATHLEREGLEWAAIDPGVWSIARWRKALEPYRARRPRTIAFCTTYVLGVRWQTVLLSLVRGMFPDAVLLIGGYFYSTDSKAFLNLPGDVYCVGEGELRLPAVVRAVQRGGGLGDIPGLYLRGADGRLHHTGASPQLSLGDLPPVDWRLAASPRMHPAVSLDDILPIGLETQRGCVFKCEFCTFRTLIGPNAMTADQGAEAIRATDSVARGYLQLVDATATFPHDRWRDLLRALIARGGSPHPAWLYGRVSDLSPDVVELMARANVTAVFVGQESGDQRILRAMKKGTHISQIKPAVAAMGQHGISAHFSFIHGFPGEDHGSLANTRNVILTLNDGFERKPVVLFAHVGPMQYYDFSTAGQSSADGGPGWGTRLFGDSMRNAVAPRGWGHTMLETWIQMSKVPHAPLSSLYWVSSPGDALHMGLYTHPRRHEIFHWGKAVQRGIAIFLEREWEGKAPDGGELRRVAEQIRAELPRRTVMETVRVRAVGDLRRRILRRVISEVRREPDRGPGLVTRALSAIRALNDTARLGSAVDAWRTTLTSPLGAVPEGEPAIVDALAKDLVRDSVSSSLAWRQARRLRTVVR